MSLWNLQYQIHTRNPFHDPHDPNHLTFTVCAQIRTRRCLYATSATRWWHSVVRLVAFLTKSKTFRNHGMVKQLICFSLWTTVFDGWWSEPRRHRVKIIDPCLMSETPTLPPCSSMSDDSYRLKYGMVHSLYAQLQFAVQIVHRHRDSKYS